MAIPIYPILLRIKQIFLFLPIGTSFAKNRRLELQERKPTLKQKADCTLDIRGIIAPFSILKVSLAFQRMKPKQIMQVMGCDPEMQRDLLRVLPKASYSIVSVEPLSEEMDMTILRLQKEEKLPKPYKRKDS